VKIIAPVITIDGPSGSGKGTVAGILAKRLGWNLLDSGALYRLLAFAAYNHGVDLTNEELLKKLAAHLDVQFIAATHGQLQRIILEGDEVSDVIRTESVGSGASQVAALPAVREALLQRQRAFQEAPGLVADGRDMGTVVFPAAQLKVFLTASAAQRADRRHKQLISKGIQANIEDLRAELEARDLRDRSRSLAPLRAAEDALSLDNSALTVDESVEVVLGWWRQRRSFE
jgi:cytidylate kinase